MIGFIWSCTTMPSTVPITSTKMLAAAAPTKSPSAMGFQRSSRMPAIPSARLAKRFSTWCVSVKGCQLSAISCSRSCVSS
ncbi:MAG: hypothetical protein RLO54_33945 [Sandaracinaceae bacterium]